MITNINRPLIFKIEYKTRMGVLEGIEIKCLFLFQELHKVT